MDQDVINSKLQSPVAHIPSMPRPTPEMLARRSEVLDATAGIWNNQEGARIERELCEMFRGPDQKEDLWADRP